MAMVQMDKIDYETFSHLNLFEILHLHPIACEYVT